MNQAYLDIARRYLVVEAAKAPAPADSTAERLAGEAKRSTVARGKLLPKAELPSLKEPAALAAHRDQRRTCSNCGHGMSIVAVRDICGRCVAQKMRPPSVEAKPADALSTLLGLALVAVDRSHYPRLKLAAGTVVGEGIENWGPVLRGMDTEQLTGLLDLLNKGRR